MDLAALKAELQADPAGLGYVLPDPKGDPDALVKLALAAAALGNAPGRAVRRLVPVDELQAWMGLSGVLYASQLALALFEAAPTAEAAPVVAAIRTIDRLCARLAALDVDSPQAAALLDGLQAAGVVTPEQRAEATALGGRTVSRFAELGFGAVTHLEVIAALREG